MATYAPDLPTTAELHERYPLSDDAYERISASREAFSDVIRTGVGFIGASGSCSLTNNVYQTHRQGDELAKLSRTENGLVTVQREPMWKPRSNPDDWHGLETTEPEAAYNLLSILADAHAGLAVEVRTPEHIDRYGHLLTFAWIGARSLDDTVSIMDIARKEPTLPLGIKNGLDGDIGTALSLVEQINVERGEHGAPAVLIYRGGENAKTEEEWRTRAIQAVDKTEGKVIIDVAHGSEMAHHPTGDFAKSILGQTACLASLASIMRDGSLSSGVMIEASATPSKTDPVIDPGLALDHIKALNAIKQRS